MLRRVNFFPGCASSTLRIATTANTSFFLATTTTTQLVDAQRHASKSSGTTTKYQARPSRDKTIGFKVYLGQPVLKGMELLRQKQRTNHRWGVREPDYHPGRNVTMHAKVRNLTADVSGVPTLRKSKIDPVRYEWLDVEPDIQKVYRTAQLRKLYFAPRGRASEMSGKHNARYAEEEEDLREPDWRQRVMRKMPLTERFPDPNLLTRGLVKSIAPKPRFFHE